MHHLIFNFAFLEVIKARHPFTSSCVLSLRSMNERGRLHDPNPRRSDLEPGPNAAAFSSAESYPRLLDRVRLPPYVKPSTAGHSIDLSDRQRAAVLPQGPSW